jgi:hypothetical protein
MAVYKVIQDVEAEDKLLGPFTFKGFIYGLIAIACGYLSFRILLIGSPIKWALLPAFVAPTLLFGVLASPLGRDQPTEVWLLSRIRFMLKPRLRTWDQSGIEELVTITAPKKIEQQLTDNLSQREVRSRLKTLASTLDTRGWAIKNVSLNLSLPDPKSGPVIEPESDRLVEQSEVNQAQPIVEIHPSDDILDEEHNPTAQKFASLMQTADEKRRREVLKTMKGLIDDSDNTGLKLPETTKELDKQMAKARASFAKEHHKHRVNPENSRPKPAVQQAPQPVTTPVTPERQAVNMELAQSGSAFSVSTLSQLANRQPRVEQISPNEVAISLH